MISLKGFNNFLYLLGTRHVHPSRYHYGKTEINIFIDIFSPFFAIEIAWKHRKPENDQNTWCHCQKKYDQIEE